MSKFGLAKGLIRTDQGSELGQSGVFCNMMLDKFGYVVEPTGADSPSQNGSAEINDNTLAVKVQILL